MTTREGSLEAPTRHPIDWRNPEFFDHAALEKEQERIFEICHGCRRCVSLCGAFPTLFDLIDEGKSGEIDGVAKKDFVKVVDQCYLCDLCYMTKCPYVPPHEWNVDFPHTMLQAKAVKFKKHGVTFGEKAVALKMDRLQINHNGDGAVQLMMDVKKEELANAPSFKSKRDQEAEKQAAERARNQPPAQRPTTQRP